MKSIQFSSVTIFCLITLLFTASCKKFLTVESRDRVSDETLWSNKENADLFLNNVYASLPDPANSSDPGENWSDNAVNGVNGFYSQTVYALSAYTPSTAVTNWGFYGAIRKANLFIEKVTAANLPDDWKKLRLAEARYLRAYYYMLLWTVHGGVPLVVKVLNQNEQGEAIFQARNSAEEVFDFIRDECDAITTDLPLKADAGRATQGAVLTLKGWVELFWASPLYNISNDKQRWAAAATTFKRVMDLNAYSLFPDYSDLFLEKNNNNAEVIFARQYLGGTALASSRDGLQGPAYQDDGTFTSWGVLNPTQEIVDEYFMANGLPISDPASGYDPQNPYINREKRFYQSIIYDGAIWLGKPVTMKQGIGSKNATDIGNLNEVTNTGYYLRKAINPAYAVPGYNNLSSANFIFFRYAEVLLGYAEAQNEAVGPDASVYEAIGRVRARSDLPGLKAGLSQAAVRTAVQQERRVELAFEEKRWLDLLRLRQAGIKLNGVSHAMVIEKSGANWVYKVAPCVTGARIFKADKNYLLPIPQDAIDRNKNLKQNPNY